CYSYSSGDHPTLPPFPTRRSSDLDSSAPGAYNFSLEEIYARAEQGAREGALEFHIVGGLHPDLPFEYFLEMIRGLKLRCPGVHLDRKSTRLNSSHVAISYAVFCLK